MNPFQPIADIFGPSEFAETFAAKRLKAYLLLADVASKAWADIKGELQRVPGLVWLIERLARVRR